MALTKEQLNNYLDKAIEAMDTIIESKDASIDIQLQATETLAKLIQTRHEINT